MDPNNDFDELVSLLGVEDPERGWYVYYTGRGFIEGVQSPDGTEPGCRDHYRNIQTLPELRAFLKLHHRIDLQGIIQRMKPKFPGQKRRRISKRQFRYEYQKEIKREQHNRKL
jgi:hypothetical protein